MIESSSHSGFWPSIYDPLRGLGARIAKFLTPASEAGQARDAYHISVELPGVAEEDVEVSVQDGVITVKGEKRQEREEEGDGWYFSERQYGAFSRAFRLPPDADGKRVSAELRDGVLSLTVPRLRPRAPEATRVKIRHG